MPLRFCPVCQQRIIFQNYDVDVQHDCNTGKDVFDLQDKVNIEQDAWNWAGIHNELFGKRSWIEGEDLERVTQHGRRRSTHTQVNRVVHIDLDDTNKRRKID